MNTPLRVIDKTVFVRLDFTLWSGRAKLRREDIPDADKLPPDELASLGSKRLFDPAKLRPFGALKSRAHSLLEKNGIKFCGGYAVSHDKIDALNAALQDIWIEFEQAKQDFCNNYSTEAQEWLDRHPDWADILRNAMPLPHEMPHRFHYSWQMFKIDPATTNYIAQGNDSHDNIYEMGETALAEICQMAKEIYERTFADKVELKGKSFLPIKRLIDKVDAVSFVHPRLLSIREMLTSALNLVESSHYSTATVSVFKGLLASMTNQYTFSTLLNGMQSDDCAAELLDVLWQVPEPKIENRAVTLDGPTTVVELNPIAELASNEPQPAPSFDLLGIYGDIF